MAVWASEAIRCVVDEVDARDVGGREVGAEGGVAGAGTGDEGGKGGVAGTGTDVEDRVGLDVGGDIWGGVTGPRIPSVKGGIGDRGHGTAVAGLLEGARCRVERLRWEVDVAPVLALCAIAVGSASGVVGCGGGGGVSATLGGGVAGGRGLRRALRGNAPALALVASGPAADGGGGVGD